MKISYPKSENNNVNPVNESVDLSIEEFIENHKMPQIPVKIKKSIEHWPAIEDQKWNFEHFKTVYGSRTVPIELGKRYTGKSFLEALIFASTNPQYDDRLFIELRAQYMKIASSEHVVYRYWFLF